MVMMMVDDVHSYYKILNSDFSSPTRSTINGNLRYHFVPLHLSCITASSKMGIKVE